ncbi:hypothetical protein AZE42_06033 [Rhizopogon vesiculosus]|uniref:F-box domain-containing protein n=1 Tax=Rhizopogon vesiculosus TaxID=180088 RepID=A0A1J8R4W8_9AGAM|nr:hypothetical protein AZE42_06033 [Rhizopogon vesiculosus]
MRLKGSIQKQLGKLPFKLFRRALNPSRATSSEPPSECANLPTELYFLIFTYATAKPSFATIDYPSLNPYYSSMLALCRVSRNFRRIALPFLLHTIFLSKAKHVLAFVHALHMQRAYAKQENLLYFDYAAHVHSLWIGNTNDNSRLYRSLYTVDFSLLAPVLLASKSLALDYASLFLLDSCLKYAWNSRTPSNINHKSSPLPWSVKTLTLSGNLASYLPTARTAEGHAFLASLSHIIFFPSKRKVFTLMAIFYPPYVLENPIHYDIPECLNNVPWDSLKGLQSVSLALPHITTKSNVTFLSPKKGYLIECEVVDPRIDLMTVSAPVDLLSDDWTQNIPDASRREEGYISSVTFCATSTCSGTIALHDYKLIPWEQVWVYFMTADIRYN